MISADPTGWKTSADAWAAHVERDVLRLHILDPLFREWLSEKPIGRCVDIGCGEGRLIRLVRELGGESVGVEPFHEMAEYARQKTPGAEIVEAFAEELPFEDNSFDTLLCCLVLLDVPDYRAAIREFARVLKPGGRIIVANLHPIITNSFANWTRDERGRALSYPVESYTFESGGRAKWSGIDVVNYHRPLGDYLSAFLESGLILSKFVEPIPALEVLKQHPQLWTEFKTPFTVMMEWTK